MSTRQDRLTQLFLRIRDSDGIAMQELFLAERASLQRLFVGLGRCPNKAEDLVQSTFLNLWRYRGNYQARGSAAAYLYRVAVNQWRLSARGELRRRDLLEDLASDYDEGSGADQNESGEARLENQETMQRVWDAIDGLPKEQREVFLLHRHNGLSCPEISEATDVNVKTVESRLRLALQKLCERLQPVDPIRSHGPIEERG